MARVTAPLLSFGGSGAIAKTQVYASWKGRQYARRYVVPANPDSDAQKLTRAVFAYLFGLYRYSASGALSAMAAAATGARLTTPNMFVRANLHTLRAAVANDALVLSPGYGGAPVTPDAVITPGTTNLSCAIPAPTLPNGWTAVPLMYAAAVLNWSGSDYTDVGADYTMHEVSEGTPSGGTYTCDITGLVTGTDYTVAAFYSVARPDGVTAWGVSSVQVGTTS